MLKHSRSVYQVCEVSLGSMPPEQTLLYAFVTNICEWPYGRVSHALFSQVATWLSMLVTVYMQ